MFPVWPKSAEAWEPPCQDVHFGFGTPENEARCKRIRVFIRCVGRLRMDKQHFFMAPSDTVADAREKTDADARKKFGRDMLQGHVRDERGFEIGPNMQEQPLSDFSSKCKLNLDFTYTNPTIKEFAKERVAGAGEAMEKALERAAGP